MNSSEGKGKREIRCVSVESNLMAVAVVEYHKHACPHCGRAFLQTLARKSILLGPGTRKCRGCGNLFQDGSHEWPQLSWTMRSALFMPLGLRLWLASCLGVPLALDFLSLVRGYGRIIPSEMYLVMLAPFSVVAVPYWVITAVEAVISIWRFSHEKGD